MALVVVVLVLAAAIGIAAGGRPAALSRVPLTGWRLLASAAVCQVAGSLVARGTGWSAAYAIGSVSAVVLLVAFLLSNNRLPGVPLVAAGLVLNALVIAANGAMPVSLWAARKLGIELGDIAVGKDARHMIAGPGTSLRMLSDHIPAAVPGFPEVVSPGDVLVAAGLGLLMVMALRWPQNDERADGGSAWTGTPEDAVRETTRASASTTRGSYS